MAGSSAGFHIRTLLNSPWHLVSYHFLQAHLRFAPARFDLLRRIFVLSADDCTGKVGGGRRA
jgi:hypothetical protein